MNQYYKLFAATLLAVSSLAAKAQCDTVTNFTFNNVTSSKAVASWDPVANIIDYEYGIRTDNNPPIQGAVTTNTSVLVQGISPNTTIYVCVRTRCNAGLSPWTCSSFKTLPAGTGINNVAEEKTGVYPNPVMDVLNFNFAAKTIHHITVVNSIGSVVSTHVLQSGDASLNVSQLPAGLYFVKCASENNTETFKIEKR